MAKDDFTGNMPTELMLEWFSENNVETGIDEKFFQKSYEKAITIFPK